MGIATLRVHIDADGTQRVVLEVAGDRETLATEPAWLSISDSGDWSARLARELRHRAGVLELAAAALAGTSKILPLVVDDRRPIHTCALPPGVHDHQPMQAVQS